MAGMLPATPGLLAQGIQKRPAAEETHAQLTERANQNTVSVISGTPAGTYLTVAYDNVRSARQR